VAKGTTSWAEYSNGGPSSDEILKEVMYHIMNRADLLCTTPANTEEKPIIFWKTELANGIAVDEAGNSMSLIPV
jgi:hypothetical protein